MRAGDGRTTGHREETDVAGTASSLSNVFAVLLAVPAIALTAFIAYAGIDMATTTYFGYEVGAFV